MHSERFLPLGFYKGLRGVSKCSASSIKVSPKEEHRSCLRHRMHASHSVAGISGFSRNKVNLPAAPRSRITRKAYRIALTCTSPLIFFSWCCFCDLCVVIWGVVRTSVQPATQLLEQQPPRCTCSTQRIFGYPCSACSRGVSLVAFGVCVCVHCVVKILFASQGKKKPRFSNGVCLFVSLPLVFDGA